MLNIQDVRLEDTRVYQDMQEEVRVKDRQGLIVGQLSEILGALPEVIQAQIAIMTLDQLEALSKALLHFKNLTDLENWLTANI
jgi:predicted transposase YdaD